MPLARIYRPLLRGRVRTQPRCAAALVGRPVPTPPGVAEEHGIEYSEGVTLDLVRPEELIESASARARVRPRWRLDER